MIKKLSVAEYKAYMAPAPTFNMMCDQLTRTSGKHFAENLTWDWETFKKTTPLKEINFDVRASSSTAVNNGKGLQGALAGIPTHNPVQQREDALKKTIRLSNGGVAKNDIAVTYIPTRSEITGNTVPTVDGVTFYGNGANYSNGVTSSNDMDTSNDVNSSRRILADADYNYLLVSCFTGFGSESVVNTYSLSSNVPSWDACTDKIKTVYSLKHLETVNNAAKN